MNTAEDLIILQGHVYQHNKKKLTIGLFKPAKLKNSRYFLNTPRMGSVEANPIVDRSISPSFSSTCGPVHCLVETAVSSLPCEAFSS